MIISWFLFGKKASNSQCIEINDSLLFALRLSSRIIGDVVEIKFLNALQCSVFDMYYEVNIAS